MDALIERRRLRAASAEVVTHSAPSFLRELAALLEKYEAEIAPRDTCPVAVEVRGQVVFESCGAVGPSALRAAANSLDGRK